MPDRTVVVDGLFIDIPKAEEVHYSAKIPTDLTTEEAARWWRKQADNAMRYQLSEEIEAGQHKVGSKWWIAEVHKRALELIEADDDMRPAYRTRIYQAIEDNALYSDAGYESSEEWFKSTSALRHGGFASDLRWWGSFFIPWCKQNKVFESDEAADRWFFTPVNQDGSSRQGPLRDATPDLRNLTERNTYDLPPSEQVIYVKNIIAQVQDINLTRNQKKARLNEVRQAKMVIEIYRSGSDQWHIYGDLTDHQKERLERDLQFSAIIKLIEPPEPTEQLLNFLTEEPHAV
jgi:hypothetical protein